MKYFSRLKIYKAQNVTFDPNTIAAYSYGWWQFVRVIDGLVVFNNYRYSVTTAKHQSKVRSLMRELEIKIDIEAPFKSGLQNIEACERETIIAMAEENLCDAFLRDEEKAIQRSEKAKARRERIKALNVVAATMAAHESRERHLSVVQS